MTPESRAALDRVFEIRPSRYAKGKTAIRCPTPDGYKTRAARLAERLANGRYSGREDAYILSPAAEKRFRRLLDEGWDASVITGELRPPKQNTETQNDR